MENVSWPDGSGVSEAAEIAGPPPNPPFPDASSDKKTTKNDQK